MSVPGWRVAAWVLSGSMSSSMVLLSSKFRGSSSPQSLAGVNPKGLWWCCEVVRVLQGSFITDGRKLLLYEPFHIHHFLWDTTKHTYIVKRLQICRPNDVHPPTSGQALWGRPRYDLKVMLAGLMRLFIFSAVWLPNTKGTRGSASPWHWRTCMSLLTLLVDAWE